MYTKQLKMIDKIITQNLKLRSRIILIFLDIILIYEHRT